MTNTLFTEDYYERGIEAGLSCYQDYRWLPEKTIPAVMSYIDFLDIKRGQSVLDFGCAKGFYVKALRMLHREAYGCDISEYAIEYADESIKQYVRVNSFEDIIPFDINFDYVVAKDVLEHMEFGVLTHFLSEAKKKTNKLFIVVPLAKNGAYVIPSDEEDVTHLIRFSREQWTGLFNECGWCVEKFRFNVPGLKEHQTIYFKGVGFFVLNCI
jgi:SAM-dependent methyltransferase